MTQPITKNLLPQSMIMKLHTVRSCFYTLKFLNTYQRVSYAINKFFDQAFKLQNKVAITEAQTGRQYTYGNLLTDSAKLANALIHNANDIKGKRICFLFDPSYDYVVTLFAVWRAGAVAVPLCNTHPTMELEYYITDSQSELVLYGERFETVLRPLKENRQVKYKPLSEILSIGDKSNDSVHFQKDDQFDINERALFIYTSGTTGPPKGVVSTHHNVHSQTTSLVTAWGWASNDHIMHVLPLHHVHGVVAVLLCPLYVGASLTFVKFDPFTVWHDLFDDNVNNLGGNFTLFMAVPTIYAKLITYFQSLQEKGGDVCQFRNSKKNNVIRLMVSGSAALPETRFKQWFDITGHTLLERYGMTEIGLVLSNPLHPVTDRIPGTVGKPLPLVTVTLDNPEKVNDTLQGELLVRGPTVFKEYWNKPEATKKVFKDGWFITGDLASVDSKGVYRILGRLNADIIKTGGYKVSALDIEHVLLSHPKIRDIAVFGVEDDQWGERVAALVVLNNNNNNKKDTLTLEELKAWSSSRLANYKIPTLLEIVDEIPKNTMGKVNKKQLAKDYAKL